jgi:hypothetical protein
MWEDKVMRRFIGSPTINITQQGFWDAMSNYDMTPPPQPIEFPYNIPMKFRAIETYSGVFLPVYYYLEYPHMDERVAWMDKKYTHAECMFDENQLETWA